MIAAGIGFASACEAADIVAAVEAAAREAGLAAFDIDCLCTAAFKADATALHSVAEKFERPLTFLDESVLARRNGETATHSDRVAALTGLSSLAEAAALAGAGPRSHLLGPRVVHGLAACALAISESPA
ncbi:MAG: cobalamin biosynthesis protein [Parvibaculum sp.]|uniref:cobalamin biosynthesis protein n=1 Tax=Parvibaculum sp. TaxID=2024848 RepID=UPI0025F363CE|nr:cobalamin biosynthesis protein [Parvibaculum sp.]MCE9649035.1 cobalamin biosynthesis protein [Parvibaculum sp.]